MIYNPPPPKKNGKTTGNIWKHQNGKRTTLSFADVGKNIQQSTDE